MESGAARKIPSHQDFPKRFRPQSKAIAFRIFRGAFCWLVAIGFFWAACPRPIFAATPPPSKITLDAGEILPQEEEPQLTPEQRLSLRKRMLQALLSDDFHYRPKGLPDPFVPFIAPETRVTESLPETKKTPPPTVRLGLPLTPLQKMQLGEIERGLKAIVWGAMGSRALIEDASGKGYIVKEGTPVTAEGVVERIYKDALVIRRYVWNRKERRWVPKFVTIRLKKSEKEGQESP